MEKRDGKCALPEGRCPPTIKQKDHNNDYYLNINEINSSQIGQPQTAFLFQKDKTYMCRVRGVREHTTLDNEKILGFKISSK